MGDRHNDPLRVDFDRQIKPDRHSERSDIPAWSADGRWLYYTSRVG